MVCLISKRRFVMKNVDFFKDEKSIAEKCFGICDDRDERTKTPAYVNTNISEKEKWGTVVNNKTNVAINFIAVDNKIEIKRANGETENRCDAMLHNPKNIIFIELKNQRASWIEHAVQEQLQTTIDIFKQNHDMMQFECRRAYVCNVRYPYFAYSHKQMAQQFYQKNKVRLYIQREIDISK